jgi:hypothetical protein
LRYNHPVTGNKSIELLRLLAARLERLSVDSRWSRRAAGLRGNIVKILGQVEKGIPVPSRRIDLLTTSAFDILQKAAQELPDTEPSQKN